MLTRTGDYAVKAAIHLAGLQPGVFAGAKDIARQLKLPGNYLGKILRKLAEDGVVTGRKGQGGGFRLARPAEKISLIDILTPVEDLSSFNNCLFDSSNKCNSDDPCAMHDMWTKIRERHIKMLSKSTLASIMKANKKS